MPKKRRTMRPEGSQNDATLDAKIIDVWYFFEKGENARNYCIYNIFLGSGHAKTHENSIKIHVKSMLENVMQKVWTMMPKWSQNGCQNDSKIKKILKKDMLKSTLKSDAPKNDKNGTRDRLWRPPAPIFGHGGGRGFEFRLNSGDIRLDFKCNLTRPAPQAGCGGSKLVQNAPWGRPGSIACAICDVLGDVEKSMIFEIAPGSPKISKNRSLECPGAENDAPGNTGPGVPAKMGSPTMN